MGIEFFEMMDTYMTEVSEWMDFEADLEEAYPWWGGIYPLYMKNNQSIQKKERGYKNGTDLLQDQEPHFLQ